jgi:EmrB/QacA subfamily drug resistance transporter
MPAATTPAPTSGRRRTADQRWALAVAILGSTMGFLDGTVVNVALPVMQRQLAAAVDAVQWIVEAYALMVAALVLVGGALGDELGRRHVFVIGTVIFTLASLGCGLSPNIDALIVLRGVQGVGAALLVPGSLALISAAYPENTRPVAIGTWSAATSIAAAVGPLLGGWMVTHYSWRLVFFINVPLGAVVSVAATRKVPETRDPEAAGIDWAGAVLVTVALGAIVWALLEAPRLGGLSSPAALVPLLLGVMILGVFVTVEARSRRPMVPLSLFRSRTFAGANLLTLLLYAALGASFFFVPFNLIEVQRYSPAAAGAALVPFVASVSLLSRWAGSLVRRHGARLPLVAGPLVAALGLGLLAMPGTSGSYWSTFFPGILVLGIGMGITIAPLTTAVMASVGANHAGVASGINNAVSRAAGLLAVAALGIVLVTRFDGSLDEQLAAMTLPPEVKAGIIRERAKLAAAEPPSNADATTREALRRALDIAFVDGFRVLMLVCAGLAAISAGAASALISPKCGRADDRD